MVTFPSVYTLKVPSFVLSITGVTGSFEQAVIVKISIAKIVFDKSTAYQPEITLESDVETFKHKVVIIVDDVLNTGKTLAFCLRPFLSIPLKKLQVAILVDRNYPKYPISADYVGYSLSTTLSEHVKVILSNEAELGLYIF